MLSTCTAQGSPTELSCPDAGSAEAESPELVAEGMRLVSRSRSSFSRGGHFPRALSSAQVPPAPGCCGRRFGSCKLLRMYVTAPVHRPRFEQQGVSVW